MTQPWVTVFVGSLAEVIVLRARLEAEGLPTYVPDMTTKIMDPFVTGANPLAAQLRVPMDARETAQSILGIARPSLEPEPSPEERRIARVEHLGQRIRWCLVLPFLGWAVGMCLGFPYWTEARRLPAPPLHHGATLVCWWTQGLLLVGSILKAAAG